MILTITLNPAVDHTVHLDQLPEAGEIGRSEAAEVQAGGKGINVSKYLSKLGTETLATGIVDGPFGRFITDELSEVGIAHDFVEIEANTRLNTTILTHGGEYKINQSGPTVTGPVIDDLIGIIREYDPEVVVVAGSIARGIKPEDIDRIGRAGDWATAVDVAGSTLRQLESTYALCKPNEAELAAATGMPTDTIDECRAAAAKLLTAGFDRVVASLRADGAVMATDDGVLHAPALTVDVADTVGAGDSLLAGVLAELATGRSDVDALRAGIIAASRAVRITRTEILDLEDVHTDLERVTISSL